MTLVDTDVVRYWIEPFSSIWVCCSSRLCHCVQSLGFGCVPSLKHCGQHLRHWTNGVPFWQPWILVFPDKSVLLISSQFLALRGVLTLGGPFRVAGLWTSPLLALSFIRLGLQTSVWCDACCARLSKYIPFRDNASTRVFKTTYQHPQNRLEPPQIVSLVFLNYWTCKWRGSYCEQFYNVFFSEPLAPRWRGSEAPLQKHSILLDPYPAQKAFKEIYDILQAPGGFLAASLGRLWPPWRRLGVCLRRFFWIRSRLERITLQSRLLKVVLNEITTFALLGNPHWWSWVIGQPCAQILLDVQEVSLSLDLGKILIEGEYLVIWHASECRWI